MYRKLSTWHMFA